MESEASGKTSNEEFLMNSPQMKKSFKVNKWNRKSELKKWKEGRYLNMMTLLFWKILSYDHTKNASFDKSSKEILKTRMDE